MHKSAQILAEPVDFTNCANHTRPFLFAAIGNKFNRNHKKLYLEHKWESIPVRRLSQ